MTAKITKRLVALAFVLGGLSLQAQNGTGGEKSTLGIAAIKPSDSLRLSVANRGKTLELGRVIESLDGQLIDRINATRKFEIVADSDLKELIKKQDLAQSGNFDAGDKSLPQAFKLAGAKYYLVTSVDDFADVTITEELKIQKEIIHARSIRLSAVAKIYDSTTGKLLESANFQISTNKQTTDFATATVEGNRTDELLVAVARSIADKIANRVADVVFPAKVLVKTGKQIMINRGDGSGIAPNQTWEVFAVGEELIDPDTGESLGRDEVLIGRARITAVLPKTARAELEEDNGVERGAVVRRK